MKLKAEEIARLAEEKAKNPELFPEQLWVDDDHTLQSLGIHIPNKDGLPSGFLKLFPSDFIVEEITQDGTQTTIDKDSGNTADSEGATVYATLVKCGLSTLEAVEELSKLLNIPKEQIQYAGIKDKDAITSQQISFRSVTKDKIENLQSPHFFLKDIRTGKGVIQKGGLKGNRFTILLRIGADSEDNQKMKRALENIEKIKQEGFYNFFYLQRFGAPRLNNYKWGISILKGEYEKAVRGMIGDAGLREIPFFVQKRQQISALIPDWEAVLEQLREFPLIFPSETKVVEHLTKNPTDFVGALQKIENQVVLWVSAVASLVFNRKISSFLMAGIEPPHTLRLFLSTDKNDWLTYADDLEAVGLFPPEFNNIRFFRNISLNHRDLETKDKAEIHSAEVVPEGIVVSFTLNKGEYATTFLPHFINLLNGKAPEDLDKNILDTKESLGQENIENVLEYFENLNISKNL